jgi:hypothetical protein
MSQFQEARVRGKCLVCGKEILVSSTHGERHTGYCSRVCASMKKYAKRYTGARSSQFADPVDLEKLRKV